MSMNATDQTIYNAAISNGVNEDVATYIVCQARLETGNYTSGVFRDDNNCFGMHYAGQSGAAASVSHFEDGVPFAHYSSITASVADLVKWLFRRQAEGLFTVNSIYGPTDYAYNLKQGDYFAESADLYANDLESIYTAVFGDNTNTGDNTGGGGGNSNSGTNNTLLIGGAVALLLLMVVSGRN